MRLPMPAAGMMPHMKCSDRQRTTWLARPAREPRLLEPSARAGRGATLRADERRSRPRSTSLLAVALEPSDGAKEPFANAGPGREAEGGAREIDDRPAHL